MNLLRSSRTSWDRCKVDISRGRASRGGQGCTTLLLSTGLASHREGGRGSANRLIFIRTKFIAKWIQGSS